MRIFTDEHKRKISESKKGKRFSLEHRQNLSKSHTGMKKPWVTKYFAGKTYEEIQGKEKAELRKKETSERVSGEKNYFWRGGRTYEEEREIVNNRTRRKFKSNIQFKLGCLLRNRMNMAIKNDALAGSAIRDLGCSISEFKFYIEGKFQDGMNWKNWGHTGNVWHLDHIIPLAYFDLTNREQFLKACHYTNFQPMWAKENISKGAKILYAKVN